MAAGGETESEIPDWINTQPEPVYAPPRRRTIDAATLADLEANQSAAVRPARRRGQRGRRVLTTIGVAILVIIAILVGGAFWVNGHLNGHGGAVVDVTIPDQAGHATLASDLTKAHVVSNDWLFKHYLDYRGTPPVSGGTYVFHLHEGYRGALHDLGQGPKITQTRLTIPEGFDLGQIAAAVGQLPGLSASRFMTVAASGAVRSKYEPTGVNSLEGLVFPDTYFVSPGEDEQTLLQAMVNRFDQIADSVGLGTSPSTNGLQPYQTIILASLVEKEAKVEVDRGKIAQVILNRLKIGMKLQVDATVEYAEGVYKTRLLDSDLATKSPYNTYLVAGLPPGPIASPGQASLAAALNPTAGSWLYYVLIDPSGAHAFATTASEFEQLKAEAHAKGLL